MKLVSSTKSEYTYNGLLARVKKASGTNALTYIPDYLGEIRNDLVTQISGAGTVNAVYGQRYGRVSQRFMPTAGTDAAGTYFQHDLYGSTLFAADAQGVIKHYGCHDIWGMPKSVCENSSIASGLRFTTYDYDPVLDKHFAHARMTPSKADYRVMKNLLDIGSKQRKSIIIPVEENFLIEFDHKTWQKIF